MAREKIKMRYIHNPITIEKEISILYELGVPRYEIEQVVLDKVKKELSRKWN